jgi:hypothetical protein
VRRNAEEIEQVLQLKEIDFSNRFSLEFRSRIVMRDFQWLVPECERPFLIDPPVEAKKLRQTVYQWITSSLDQSNSS